jgi:hypothetical protein
MPLPSRNLVSHPKVGERSEEWSGIGRQRMSRVATIEEKTAEEPSIVKADSCK